MIAVSLCMICRDNRKTIGAVLDDAIAAGVSELCVVDTGSLDDTPEIARSKGAKVVSRKWRDDFAWAKNEALKLATNDWCFILDSDDRISNPAELRKFFEEDLARLPETTHAVQMDVSVGIEEKMTVVTQVKLLRKSAGLYFRYPIHENVNIEGHEVYYLREVTINHHNAFDASHNERNLRILTYHYEKPEFEEETQEFQQHIRLNLAREYLGMAKGTAVEQCRFKARRIFDEFFAKATPAQMSDYWANYYYAVATDHAAQKFGRFQRTAACNPNRAEAWVEMGRALMQQRKWRQALQYLNRATQCPYPEDGIAYPPDYTWRPLILLAACWGELGDQNTAWRYANMARSQGVPEELLKEAV